MRCTSFSIYYRRDVTDIKATGQQISDKMDKDLKLNLMSKTQQANVFFGLNLDTKSKKKIEKNCFITIGKYLNCKYFLSLIICHNLSYKVYRR